MMMDDGINELVFNYHAGNSCFDLNLLILRSVKFSQIIVDIQDLFSLADQTVCLQRRAFPVSTMKTICVYLCCELLIDFLDMFN